MATTLPNDMIIYNEWLISGYMERLAEVYNFQGNTNGAITLTTEGLLGTRKETSFFKEIATADMVSDRDPNATTAVTSKKLQAIEKVDPHFFTRFGPFETLRSTFDMQGLSPEMFSSLLGQALADNMLQDFLTVGIGAYIAATSNVTELNVDKSANTMDYTAFLDGMKALGDTQDIACFVMSSGAYYNLLGNEIVAATIDSVAGSILYGGSAATFGKPVFVTDNAALKDTTAGTEYVLGLRAGAIQLVNADSMYVTTQEMLGQENLGIKWQAETTAKLALRGYSWDKTKTADRTTLKDKANWSKVVTSHKNCAGVAIKVKS